MGGTFNSHEEVEAFLAHLDDPRTEEVPVSIKDDGSVTPADFGPAISLNETEQTITLPLDEVPAYKKRDAKKNEVANLLGPPPELPEAVPASFRLTRGDKTTLVDYKTLIGYLGLKGAMFRAFYGWLTEALLDGSNAFIMGDLRVDILEPGHLKPSPKSYVRIDWVKPEGKASVYVKATRLVAHLTQIGFHTNAMVYKRQLSKTSAPITTGFARDPQTKIQTQIKMTLVP